MVPFFQTWSDFIDMGGYGFYVWLAYGISFLTLVGLAVQSHRAKKAIFNEIQREQMRERRLQNATKGDVL